MGAQFFYLMHHVAAQAKGGRFPASPQYVALFVLCSFQQQVKFMLLLVKGGRWMHSPENVFWFFSEQIKAP